jgi:transposase-like protein
MKVNEQGSKKQEKVSIEVVKDAGQQIRSMIEEKMRGSVLSLIQDLFSEEVGRLCGSKFSHKKGSYAHRGGNDPGSVLLRGQRVRVTKPRVRQDGEEMHLESYSALQEFDLLCDKVTRHMLSGVSTRNYEPLLDEISGSTGLKKSSVSKAFKKGSLQALDEINGRKLDAQDFITIMIDGIGFGKRCVIVAMGINKLGEKLLLGLREGDTENWEVCKDLFQSLIDRGLKHDEAILFVIDGSKAIRKAIRKVFGEKNPVQRCTRHKERNIISYLPEIHHMEFRRRWKKMHGFVSYQDAIKDHNQLIEWLGRINQSALESLEEAELETLTVVKLKVPGLLRKTLHSTNPLESTFSVVQTKVRNVKNWKSSVDQVSRWAAITLLAAEKKYRRLRGYSQIPYLEIELKKLNVETQTEVA